MDVKFTIRDFLVYFLTGFYLILIMFINSGFSIFSIISFQKEDFKEYSTIIILILIPSIYLIGQILHGLDLILFKIGRLLFDFERAKRGNNKQTVFFILLKFVVYLINGNRVSGLLNFQDIDTMQFWNKVRKLQYEEKYEKIEYWSLLNELSKGLTLVSMIWCIYYLYFFSIWNSFIFLALTFIFWYRARITACNFISAINITYKVSEE